MSRNLSIRDAVAFAINDIGVETPDQAARVALRAVVFALDCYKLRAVLGQGESAVSWDCSRCGYGRTHVGALVGTIIDVILSHEDGCR